jgi:uncharacterized membrane protein
VPDPVVVISTVVAGVIGGVGLWWSRRAGRKAGVGVDPSEAIRNLQLLADTWEERHNLEHEARMKAEQALSDERAGRAQELAEAKAAQVIERELAAQCRSDLDDVRSENRALKAQLGRRRGTRAGS